MDLATAGIEVTGEELKQSAFAGAVSADNPDGFARSEAKIDRPELIARGKAHGQLVCL